MLSPRAVSALVRPAATVASTASPRAPPTWAVVFTSPDARPASSEATPPIATVISTGKASPAPAPIISMAGRMCSAYPPWTGTMANKVSAAPISTSPVSRVARAPNRVDSRSAYRTDTAPITDATGRKASPIRSGL